MSAVHDYTFASDNTAGLTPEALAALTGQCTGRVPSYGDDALDTARAKALLRGVFETECEVFFVFNGTAANALALAQFCRSHHSVLCHNFSHVDTDECAAPEFFTGGSKVIAVAGPDGKLRPADLAPVFSRGHGVHYPKPGALSLTQSTEWGTVYTPAEIGALSALAKSHGLAVHMDGARFANAAAALAPRGVTPADLTWRAGVDVLCFGGTKNGLLGTEAVVFFNRTLARDFDRRVKQSGQLDSKMRFAAAQWDAILRDGAWLRHAAHANAMARKLAAGLRASAASCSSNPKGTACSSSCRPPSRCGRAAGISTNSSASMVTASCARGKRRMPTSPAADASRLRRPAAAPGHRRRPRKEKAPPEALAERNYGLLARRGGRGGGVLHADDLDLEDQRRGRRNALAAVVAVGQRRRDVELQLASDTGLLETLKHAGDDAIRILRRRNLDEQLDRTALGGAVENLAVHQRAGIMHRHDLAGLGRGAGAGLEDLVAEAAGQLDDVLILLELGEERAGSRPSAGPSASS